MIRTILAAAAVPAAALLASSNPSAAQTVKGKRQEIQGADVTVASNQWHMLALKAEGDSFTLSFDGTTLFTVTDKIFPDDGKVALWTKTDSVTHFDRLHIRSLP
jgi:hypothetical protein